MTEALQTAKDRQIKRPATLKAFDSACSTTEVGQVVVRNGIAQSRDIIRLSGEVAKGPDANPQRVTELSTQVNETVYTAFERMYGLTPEGQRPVDFFQRHMNVADTTVRFLAESVNPKDPILTEPSLEFETPADVVRHLSSPDTDGESRRAVTTRLAFALTSAEQEQYYKGTEKVLSDTDRMIQSQIITVPRDSGMIYTVHDETNAIERTAQSLNDLFGKPIKEGHHVKQHDLQGDFQDIGYTDDSELGLVAVRSRIKSKNTALLKTVRSAIECSEGKVSKDKNPDDGDKLMAHDTKDFMGSTFVALDVASSKDEKVTKLREKVVEQYKQMYGLTDDDFEEDSQTNKRSDQRDFNFQRVLVHNIPGTNGYYEIMFFGQDYFNYKYAVGNTDQETGLPDGAAHALYEGSRFFKTYNTIFKPENPEEIERDMYAERAAHLQADNRVDTADLEKEYAAEIEFRSGGDIFNGSAYGGLVFANQ